MTGCRQRSRVHGCIAKSAKLVGCGTLFPSETGRKWLCAEDLQNEEGGRKDRNYVFVWHISLPNHLDR
jgi:hypothetical protein